MTGIGIPRWIKRQGIRSAFDMYYAQVVRTGGTGLPTVREARDDLRAARRWEMWPYSSTVN